MALNTAHRHRRWAPHTESSSADPFCGTGRRL